MTSLAKAKEFPAPGREWLRDPWRSGSARVNR